jgi:L,D-transpeptidase YbiS
MQPRIEIGIGEQRLRLWEGGRLAGEWPVSTALAGTGCREGSLQTPLGRFRICEKIGHGAPERTLFQSRQPVGLAWVPSDDDQILTRILWLDGLDPENANTRDRYIYIHGTNHEDRIGIPVSHGCIRMRNADILELFDRVEVGTEVRIGENFER